MEFYLEFLLTAAISILIVFLIGKIASGGQTERDSEEEVALTADLGRVSGEIGGGAGVAVLEEEERERSMEVKTDSGGCGDTANAGLENDEFLESRTINIVEVEGPVSESGLLEGEGMERSVEVRRREEVEFGEDSGKEVVEEVEIDRIIHGDLVKDERLDSEEVLEKAGVEGQSRRGEEEERSLLNEEEEWEGIERSQAAKIFGLATAYVGSEKGAEALSKLSSDVQMQLYALHKVATEGPCYESQPMALKVSARAKWNAWQKLGNITPEMAMEKYTTLLSESISGWMVETPREDAQQGEGDDSLETRVTRPEMSVSTSTTPSKLILEAERAPEEPTSVGGGDTAAGSKHFEQGLTRAFFINLLSPTPMRFLTVLW